MERSADFIIRPATVADGAALVRHRCEMFRDMGKLRDDAYDRLAQATASYYSHAMPSGEYVAWVVSPASQPDLIVAGGGMQLRHILPRPTEEGYLLEPGPQGLIVNVYTEKDWRRKGLADMVMNAIIKWSKAHAVPSLVLHASQMGQPIYERLGFRLTNEMSYPMSRLARNDALPGEDQL